MKLTPPDFRTATQHYVSETQTSWTRFSSRLRRRRATRLRQINDIETAASRHDATTRTRRETRRRAPPRGPLTPPAGRRGINDGGGSDDTTRADTNDLGSRRSSDKEGRGGATPRHPKSGRGFSGLDEEAGRLTPTRPDRDARTPPPSRRPSN